MDQATPHDVFVSHNGLDKPLVERLCWALLEAGLRPWFDKWDLVPGDVWMDVIERVLDNVPAVLVCVGPHGLSAWHDAERRVATDRANSKGSVVVVPVLLPGAPEVVSLPGFLRERRAVDLREDPAWKPGIARLTARLTKTDLPRERRLDDTTERPYRGLEPFKEADAGWMFGREREEAELLEALRQGQRFITVVGASGSGKSSLVRAGVVPAVRTGAVEGRQRWHALVMRPKSRPCHELALLLLDLRAVVEQDKGIAADLKDLEELRSLLEKSDHGLSDAADRLLARKDRDEQLLVVLDQFEELFTEPAGGGPGGQSSREHADGAFVAGTKLTLEGAALLRNLLYAAGIDGSRVRVLLTVRADFTAECLAIPELARRMKQMNFALPPMEAEQLREAVRRPALRMGYDVEKALVDVLVGATADQPGRLPLLQHTLDLLWDVRERGQRKLTYAAYREHVGSLEESVANRAEKVFTALMAKSADNEAVVRRVFLRLVHLGEGTGDTRRQVRRSELSSDAAASAVLDEFIEARLVVSDIYRGGSERQEQAAEIAHEALLGRWGRLRRWLNENREALRIRQELYRAADEWRRRGHPVDELWRGGRLARASETLTESDIDLSENERAFLDASEMTEKEIQRGREEALQAKEDALKSKEKALQAEGEVQRAKELALQAQEETQRMREDAEHAREARRIEESRRQRKFLGGVSLVAILLSGLSVLAGWQYLMAARARDDAGQLATDNKALAIQKDEEARKARAATREEQGARASVLARVPGRELEALELAVRAVGGEKKWGGDASSQATQGLLEALAKARRVAVLEGHTKEVWALAWTPDGTRLATASEDGTARLWDGKTGASLATLEGHKQAVRALAWATDGTHLATASLDGTVRLWDGKTGASLATLEGHKQAVVALAWTDSTRLATASLDGTARLWDGETGAPLATLEGHTKAVWALAWTTDSTRLATASEDGTVRLWDGRTGASLATLEGHTKVVWALAWMTDGTRLATASWDGTARLWDGKTGASLATLEGHTKAVMALAWTTDGTRLATASLDGTARLWDGKTGALFAVLEGHAKEVVALAWTTDGTRLATASLDETARLWDGKTGASLATLGHTKAVVALAWTIDGTRLATASEDGRVRLWDSKTGAAALATLEGHTDAVWALAWTTDGTRLATASLDGRARLWDGKTGASLATLEGHTKAVLRLAWTTDGTRLATASRDGAVRLWDGKTGAALATLEGHTEEVRALAWTLDGTRLATASLDGRARLWDGKTGASLATLEGHTKAVVALAWTLDGTRLATASADGRARLWDGKTGAALATLEGHTDAVWALAWTTDGTRLATASEDGRAWLWDGKTGASLATLEGHKEAVVALAWTTDGTRLATASVDGTARLWDGKTGASLATLEGHKEAVRTLAWTTDGTRLAMASLDGTARIWDGKTGAALATLEGHTKAVVALAWTLDGTRLATASWDGTARLWDGKTGASLATLEGHMESVRALAWTTDGTRLATASWDGTAKLWLGSPQGWLNRACEILEASPSVVVLDSETEAICADVRASSADVAAPH